MRSAILLALVLTTTAFAGCLDSAVEEPLEAAAIAAATPPAAPVEILFQDALRNGVGACEFAVTQGCPVWLQPEGQPYFEETLTADMERVELTLAWEATSLNTDWLGVTFVFENSKGEMDYVYEMGGSPVVLKKKGPFAAGTEIGIYVWVPCNGALLVFACVNTAQPFEVVGTLTPATPVEAATA